MKELWLNPLAYGPVIIRRLAAAGWAHLLVDLEHNFLTEEQLVHALSLIGAAGARAIVRPPDQTPRALHRAIEAGARRFLIPGVEDAQALITLHDAARESGHEVDLVPLVENSAGLAQIAEIASLDFVRSIHIGPFDLSRDLGIADWRDFERLRGHIEPALGAIRRHGRLAGCYLLPAWVALFPLASLDIASFGIHELTTPGHDALAALLLDPGAA